MSSALLHWIGHFYIFESRHEKLSLWHMHTRHRSACTPALSDHPLSPKNSWNVFVGKQTRPWDHKKNFMLNSTIFQLLIKTKMLKNKDFSFFKFPDIDVVYILPIDVKMPTNCWHFNIYEQDRFCDQLSWARKMFYNLEVWLYLSKEDRFSAVEMWLFLFILVVLSKLLISLSLTCSFFSEITFSHMVWLFFSGKRHI